MRNSNGMGRVAKWGIELQAFDLEFLTTKKVKSKALADFVAEWTDPSMAERIEEISTLPGKTTPGSWSMNFDGACGKEGAGAGIILTSPTGDKLYYAIQLFFGTRGKISNNIAEYEGLVCGLKAAIALGVKHIVIKGDSQLIINFSTKTTRPGIATWTRTSQRCTSSRSVSSALAWSISRVSTTRTPTTSPEELERRNRSALASLRNVC